MTKNFDYFKYGDQIDELFLVEKIEYADTIKSIIYDFKISFQKSI